MATGAELLRTIKEQIKEVDPREVHDAVHHVNGNGNGSGPTPVHVARRGKSPRLNYGPGSPINELLSPRANSAMEVFWVEAAVGAGSGLAHHHHDGEEFGFIVQGCMVIEIDGVDHVLEEGDSIYFRSSSPHQWTSRGPDELRAIWVITPPTF